MHVIRMNSDLMVTTPQIKLRKVLGISQSLKKLVDAGQRITIKDCYLIQGHIIHTHADSSVLFGDKEDRRPQW